MKFTCLFLALAIATPAAANDLVGVASVTSRYVSRGTDQNINHKPSAQMWVGYNHDSGLYGSAFAATMNYGEGTKLEFDVFGGYRKQVGKFNVDVGFANINYPNNKTPLNFVEYDLKVDHPVGKGNVGSWVGYTPAYFNTYGKGIWTEVHGSYPISQKLTVSASAANQDLPNNFSYKTWLLGANYMVNDHINIDLKYTDTDRHDLDPIWNTYGERLSATVNWVVF